ncbi:MAG: serine/threonine-protein kinase [Planctomycetota bacterium JB042]
MSVDDERLREVLIAWYAAREAGESVDLLALCGGDEAFAAEVTELLASDPMAASTDDAFEPPAPRDPDEEGDAGAPPVEQLGPYRLRTRIGEGGMGQVYLAEQVDLDRLVAVKILRTDGRADPKAKARLEREAKLASSLDHPNIVPVHAVDEQDGLLYVVMKWLSGPGLEHVVGRVTPREAAEITAKIARALDEAHRSGVLHRDVKPANVILDRGTPYLVDFGLARDLALPLSRSQRFAGTLAYMPPEQLGDQPDEVDARSDVYALGATLFELVTGRRLCAGDSAEGLLSAALNRDTLPVRLDRRERDLEAIISRATAREKEDRFPSAGAFADDLERYLRDEPVLARPLGPAAIAWRRIKRRPRTSATIAAVTLAAVAASVLALAESARSRGLIESIRSGARTALGAGDLATAEERLDELAGETAPTPGDRALREELTARRALETLLDQLMSTWETQPPALLEELVADVEAEGARRFDPWRTGVALALASIHLAPEETIGRLEALEAEHGPRRATAALRALAERRDEIPRTPEARSPLDHVVTFLALRMAYAPLADRKAEIDAAADAWSDDYRVGLAEVMHHVDAGAFDFAYRLLRKLPEPKRPTPMVIGKRVHLLLLCGRWDEALAAYDSIPSRSRTGWDITNRLTILHRMGEHDAVERELAAARAARPDDTFLMLFEVRRRLADEGSDGASARRMLDRIQRAASVSLHAETARAIGYLLDLNGIVDLPDERQSAEVLRLRSSVSEFLSTQSRSREASSLGHFVLGESFLFPARDRSRAISEFRRAIELDPSAAEPRRSFVRVVFWRAANQEDGEGSSAPTLRSLQLEAIRILEGLLDQGHRGKGGLGESEELAAWADLLRLALAIGDDFAICGHLRRIKVRDHLPWPTEAREFLDRLSERYGCDS